MAGERFLLVYTPDIGSRQEEISTILNGAKDWVLVSSGCWLIWSRRSAKTWFERIKPVLETKEIALVIDVNPNDRGGLLPSRVWKFVRKWQETLNE